MGFADKLVCPWIFIETSGAAKMAGERIVKKRLNTLLWLGVVSIAVGLLPVVYSIGRSEMLESVSCPEGYTFSAEKSAAILTALKLTGEGKRLLGRVDDTVQLCFGAPDTPSMLSSGVMLLKSGTETAEDAARVAHLLVHRVEGPPFDAPAIGSRACDDLVNVAIKKEARAFAMEIRVREALGVVTPLRVYGFEPEVYRKNDAERAAFIERFLLEHPVGSQNVVGYVRLYGKLCERALSGIQ